jgi:hypothetical protein
VILALPRGFLRCSLFCSLVVLSGMAMPVVNADRAPSANFDLSRWKLTLPIDAMGKTSGDAAEVGGLENYDLSPFFYATADGGMVFWAPVNGATTGGSHYPRSELREMLVSGSAAANWNCATNSVLEARLKIDRVPSSSGKIVVGQIHGYNVAPLVKLQYESGGKLTALINPTPTSSIPIKYTLASGLSLNRAFEYRISVSKGELLLSANGATPQHYALDSRWQGAGLYFKAGAYVQASGSSSVDGGQAAFYRLSAMHPTDVAAAH